MTKEKLIHGLIREGYLNRAHIKKAFEVVDRGLFVPDDFKLYAYENRPLPLLGGKAAISQPLVVAFMLELLDPREGEKILEIGTGSGWQTALLSYCVCSSPYENQKDNEDSQRNISQGLCGMVISIERERDIKQYAEEHLKRFGIENGKNVVLLCRDGSRGYKKESPYDKIIAGASVAQVPQEWKTSLKVGGRMVFPSKQSIIMLEKTGKNSYMEKSYFGFSFQELLVD